MNTPPVSGEPPLWTPKSLLDWSTEYFAEKGIPTPKLDSELLLAHVLGCRRIDLYLQFDRPLTAGELGAYRELVRDRAGRIPVAYLTGEVGFWNLMLSVGTGCLIPRPETESLVEAVVDAVDAMRAPAGHADQPLLWLEFGTGCGAIPLAVCGEREHLLWLACDISQQALSYAARNRGAHEQLLSPRGNAIHLYRGDGFAAIASGARPHLIVSNPPYIPRAVLPHLEPEVASAEPAAALDGGCDGLSFYRDLVRDAAKMLVPGGRLLMEIGAEQGESLRVLLQGEGALELLQIRNDLGGRERVVHARRR